MDTGLAGRTAFITGGGGGIGSAIGRALAAEGVNIVVCDIDQAAAGRVRDQLRASGYSATAVTADVTNKTEVETAIALAEEMYGGIDILVNNAGFSRDRYLAKMADEEWDIVHQVVLKAAFYCSRAVLDGMMERRFGRIINVTSASYQGNAGQTNYSSAKAGLVGLTRALGKESGKFGITVNAIAPGLVATERLRARPDFEQLEARSIAGTPAGRLGTPEDVANVALFLASVQASFLTCETLHVTGGR